MYGQPRNPEMTGYFNNLRSILCRASSRWPQLCLASATVLSFIPVKLMMIAGEDGLAVRAFLLFIALMTGLSFHFIRARDIPSPIRIMYRGIVVLFSLYLILAAPALLMDESGIIPYSEMSFYRWGAPVLGILAFFRISWTIPLLVAAKYQKISLSSNLGLPISMTDYSPVLEFGLFLALGCIVLMAGKAWLGLWSDQKEDKDRLTPLDAVLMTAIAVHFSNYFYSGIQKILIGNSLTSWVFENPTYYLSLAAGQAGALPVSLFGHDTTLWMIDSLRMFVMPLNMLTFLTQLLAIFAITRIRVAIALTAFFDLMHLAIFLLSGIFFYKWIFLNLMIVVALTKIKEKKIDLKIRLWLISVVVCAPVVFFVAFLGWYDTPSFNDEYVEAVTETGETYRVPSNYWLSGSVTYAQERIMRVKPGFFETGSYGALGGRPVAKEALHDAQNCVLKASDANQTLLNRKYQDIDKIIMRHHRYILTRVNKEGRLPYDLYPHHIFSMPWSFLDFYRLDKTKIVAYRYVIEAKCLSARDKTMNVEIKARGEHYVPVR